jgi:tetratricopeptide (TPR) repeat protein
MNWERLIFWIRVLIALVLGFFLMRYGKFAIAGGDIGGAIFAGGLVGAYGIVLFFLFGSSFMGVVSRRFENLYMGRDEDFRIMPEYSVAEARAAVGKYQEAVDEYRKVIAEYPEDIYPHLRIAEMAVKQLNDVKLAELELLSAIGKAKGEDSTALAAGRLADFYQHTLQDPARALEVMKQLREKIPDAKQAKLAEERIVVLEGIVHDGVPLPKSPEKLASRPSRFKLSE